MPPGFSAGLGGVVVGVSQPFFELHSVHEPEQPMTFSVLQRGQRSSGDSMPHDGHFGRMATYTTPTIRATMPPARKAMLTLAANKPAM